MLVITSKASPSFPNLFSPGQIGKVTVPNRIVMLPMGQAYPGTNGEVTQKMIDSYEARAKGGTGLVMVGHASVGGQTPQNTLKIDSDWHVPGHCDLVEAVHSWGSKIAVQLNQTGSRFKWNYEGSQPVSASAVAHYYMGEVRYPEPRAMTRGEIYDSIERWAQAATRARIAGYDMIDLHAGHGYLLAQFMSPSLNRRTDEFGGSLENRMRFAVEVTKRVKREVGDVLPVGVRISADDFWPGGITLDESPTMARILEEAGADYISVSAGTVETNHRTMDIMRYEEGWKLYLWQAIKKVVCIPVIAAGGLKTPAYCEKLLADGNADFIGLGRPLLADPEWSNKARDNRVDDIRMCVSCVECIPRAGRSAIRHCSVNAEVGREREFGQVIPAQTRKKVMVIGGGPGGMEASRVAAMRGHEVILYERGSELGGGLLLASIPPGKSKWLWFRDYLTGQLKKLGVKVVLDTEVTAGLVRKVGADVVILAAGGGPLVPNIPGAADKKVLNYKDVLQGKVVIKGKKVLILGGGGVGCETAEFLRVRENEVVVVEMLPRIAADMEPLNRQGLLESLKELKVDLLTGKRVVQVYADGATITDVKSGKEERIGADYVVLALGCRSANELVKALEKEVPKLYVIGDCAAPRQVMNATYEGAIVARRI